LVNVKQNLGGAGGSVIGASVVASKIASVTIAKDVVSSIIAAGADLGSDRALGGGDDTFAPGTIGLVTVKGSVLAGIIAAGFFSEDETFKNADDTVLGGTTSSIQGLRISGTADSESYFAAGLFKTGAKIGTEFADVTADTRFKVA
jgi:hypothetical protein